MIHFTAANGIDPVAFVAEQVMDLEMPPREWRQGELKRERLRRSTESMALLIRAASSLVITAATAPERGVSPQRSLGQVLRQLREGNGQLQLPEPDRTYRVTYDSPPEATEGTGVTGMQERLSTWVSEGLGREDGTLHVRWDVQATEVPDAVYPDVPAGTVKFPLLDARLCGTSNTVSIIGSNHPHTDGKTRLGFIHDPTEPGPLGVLQRLNATLQSLPAARNLRAYIDTDAPGRFPIAHVDYGFATLDSPVPGVRVIQP